MLGFPLLYFKGMRILMFQLSGFYCRGLGFRVTDAYEAVTASGNTTDNK